MSALALAALLAAFAQVESSHNYNAMGDRGRAWGAFQFHSARWGELSTAPYRHATPTQQDDAMRLEIAKALQIASQRGIEPIAACASYHHCGHVTLDDVAYIAKIRAALKQ